MPNYTFECGKCKRQEVQFRPMREASDPAVCANCEGNMHRVYCMPQLRPETFGRGKKVSSMPSLTGRKGERDVLQSRSDTIAWTRKYNEKTGSNIKSCYEE